MFKKKSQQNNENKNDSFVSVYSAITKIKVKSITDFLVNNFEIIKKELDIIKIKSKNLLETNYQLGLKHLEKGNLGDAIFRFWLIKKFWPHHHESYIHLAKCYIIKKRYYRAKYILEQLINLNSAYEGQSKELLIKIQELESSQNI